MAELDMVMEFKFGPMAPNMKDTGRMESSTVKESSTMLMEMFTKVLYIF